MVASRTNSSDNIWQTPSLHHADVSSRNCPGCTDKKNMIELSRLTLNSNKLAIQASIQVCHMLLYSEVHILGWRAAQARLLTRSQRLLHMTPTWDSLELLFSDLQNIHKVSKMVRVLGWSKGLAQWENSTSTADKMRIIVQKIHKEEMIGWTGVMTIVKAAEHPESQTTTNWEDASSLSHQPRAGLWLRPHHLPFRPSQRSPQCHRDPWFL